jgi:hypothetical protein
LEVDSRLEIAFKGKPKGFQAPSYKVFTNDNPNGTVVFDVETRIVQRCITPGCTYKDLEIERTDLSAYGGVRRLIRVARLHRFRSSLPVRFHLIDIRHILVKKSIWYPPIKK